MLFGLLLVHGPQSLQQFLRVVEEGVLDSSSGVDWLLDLIFDAARLLKDLDREPMLLDVRHASTEFLFQHIRVKSMCKRGKSPGIPHFNFFERPGIDKIGEMIPAVDDFLSWIENVESVQDLGEILTQNPDDDLEGFLWKVIDARLIGLNNDDNIFDFARVEEVVFADHKQSLHGVEEGICVKQIEVE